MSWGPPVTALRFLVTCTNLTLVLGAAALVAPIAVHTTVVRREAPLSLLASVAFALAVQGGLPRHEGLLLLLLLALSLTVLLRWAMQQRGATTESQDLRNEVLQRLESGAELTAVRAAMQALLGLVGTLAGAQALVWGAVGVARRASLPEGFIGATIVAIGTSLPELVTAVQASRRGVTDLIVGNLLGSNLFNALAVGGVVAVMGAGSGVGPGLRRTGVGVMLATSALALFFMWRRFRVVRWEAAILVTLYVATLPLLAAG